MSRTDLRSLHQMVDALPAEGRWTADLRQRWLQMIENAVDYEIDVCVSASTQKGAVCATPATQA